MTRKVLLLLIFAAALVGAVGCEENLPEQKQEPFVPVEPGARLERHCDIVCLNTEDGSLTPLEQLQDKLQLDKKQLSQESLNKLKTAAKEQLLDVSASKDALPEPVKRFVLLNKSVPEKVKDAMKSANVRNYSVFLVKIDANYYAVRTLEYIGQNYDLDWLDLTRNPDFVEWNNACEECQIPVVGKTGEGGLIQWSLSGNEVLYLPLGEEAVGSRQ